MRLLYLLELAMYVELGVMNLNPMVDYYVKRGLLICMSNGNIAVY